MRFVPDHDLHIHTQLSPCSRDARQTPEAILSYGITAGMKLPLRAILGTHNLGAGIRYFCLTMFAGCVWPLSFRYLSKLSSQGKA